MPPSIIPNLTLAVFLIATAPLQASGDAVETIDDAAITTLVKSSLLFHLLLNSKIETLKEVVTSSGDADDVVEKLLSGRLAAAIPGVKTVVNDIIIPVTIAGSD